MTCCSFGRPRISQQGEVRRRRGVVEACAAKHISTWCWATTMPSTQTSGRQAACSSVSQFKEFNAAGYGYASQLTLCHYPMLEWNRSRHNGKPDSKPSIMVHGHIHGTREQNERNAREGVYRFDCGVDASGYAPVHVGRLRGCLG